MPIKNMTHFKLKILETTIWIGNFLTLIGCLSLFFGALGIFSFDSLSYGLSSGIRIVGSIAIAGCLLNAVGHGILDYIKK